MSSVASLCAYALGIGVGAAVGFVVGYFLNKRRHVSIGTLLRG